MEEFFKQPILEKLYDFLTIDFKRNILNDNLEGKEYYVIETKKYKVYNKIESILDNPKEELNNLYDTIKELEKYYYEETEYWNKKYFKLGFTYMLSLNPFPYFTKLEKDKITNIEDLIKYLEKE